MSIAPFSFTISLTNPTSKQSKIHTSPLKQNLPKTQKKKTCVLISSSMAITSPHYSNLKPLSIFILIFLLSSTSRAKSQRSLLDSPNQTKNSKNENQIQSSCSEIITKSNCNSNPNCRWCRSHVLDDLCTSKIEAWRLPSQGPLF
ncbi:hypothetical protein RND81_06G099900 [Saponaria officinalis]|uniref:Uncharacterized protein n=1 Tax=Saponaria officinalis TaxID=3572 RepID=A0AAW1K9D5_SAPOF